LLIWLLIKSWHAICFLSLSPELFRPHNPYLRSEPVMTSKTAILAAAVGSLFVLTTTAFAADESNSEKCYGVAKAGKNDCAGGAHACAGQSSKDKSAKEFISLPKGTCERIVGGSLTPGK
jgi:uncharacterized membrane protein